MPRGFTTPSRVFLSNPTKDEIKFVFELIIKMSRSCIPDGICRALGNYI